MNSLTLLIAAGIALGAPAGVDAPAKAAPKDDTTGSIRGKVVWEGERPEPKPELTIREKETEGCLHGGSGVDNTDHTLLIGADGGVANVVLTIEVDGFEREMPSEAYELDQKGCRFEPHVVVVPVGSKLKFANSDQTNHNIHTFAKKNQAINKNVAGGSDMEMELDKAEVIDVKCDVHTWMSAYVVVTDATHWGVTDAEGNFTISGLPPGDYKLSWWHEELGKGKTESVTVKAGEEATLTQEVGAKKKKGGGGRRRR